MRTHRDATERRPISTGNKPAPHYPGFAGCRAYRWSCSWDCTPPGDVMTRRLLSQRVVSRARLDSARARRPSEPCASATSTARCTDAIAIGSHGSTTASASPRSRCSSASNHASPVSAATLEAVVDRAVGLVDVSSHEACVGVDRLVEGSQVERADGKEGVGVFADLLGTAVGVTERGDRPTVGDTKDVKRRRIPVGHALIGSFVGSLNRRVGVPPQHRDRRCAPERDRRRVELRPVARADFDRPPGVFLGGDLVTSQPHVDRRERPGEHRRLLDDESHERRIEAGVAHLDGQVEMPASLDDGAALGE